MTDVGPCAESLAALPLTGCSISEYTAPVRIGDQSFDLLLDTGSSTTAVAAGACANCTNITPRYQAYGTTPEPVPDASPEAAAASAARVVLASVPGADYALIDKTYDASLKAATDATARVKGVALGRRVALALLAARVDDTFARVEPPKVEAAPGIHVLTPEAKQESSVAVARLRPFGIRSVAAYDPGPPPPVGSTVAQRDLAEVRALGGRVSKQRTAEQSVIALFWNSGEGENGVLMLKTLAEGLKATPLEFARMLALTDMADLDSRIVYSGIKTRYRHWRPYNALRGDFADARLRDVTWEPLIHTPPNSDYPSGGAVGGGTLQALLTAFRGNSQAPLVWVNTALSMTRSWATPDAMGRELADSRVWSGVHFRNSVDVGYRIGQRVAEEVLATQLRPLP
ncbi:MAG: hypothetical protein EOP39_00005 [Rubrivivax sp.]|nr:MAG: hypothetical protein EOP39_00005 [Rubrivivax sp.]